MLALTKTMAPADFDVLGAACRYVDSYLKDEHLVRRWEYALALEAYMDWERHTIPLRSQPAIADIGGYGSPFQDICAEVTTRPVIIDPRAQHLPFTLEAYIGEPFDVIFALSVLEHVTAVRPFLRACVRHLEPGGLLFFTIDIWDCDGPDVAHFYWMRDRIFNPRTWKNMEQSLRRMGMTRFGEVDWTFHGNQVYGSYSFASLCMRKEGD